jgi:mannose-6-phosphate isomerase-like protein (cupin superfamily)
MSEVFDLSRQLDKVIRDRPYRPYHEFLRIPAMSVGIYVLAAGAIDRQQPHREDEIYYVVRGKAKMRLGTEERSVQEGSVIFVESGLEHRFFDIEQELVLLVVFAPAETS